VRLLALWLHVLGAVVWLGGLVGQARLLAPSASADRIVWAAETARRARPVAWAALATVVLTGLYHVTGLGPLEQVLASGAALALAGKFILVLLVIALSGHRDFALVPRLGRALAAGEDPAPALRAIAWLDRLVIGLGVVIIYLGLAVSRR
jgi:uncharacterized membrane protein